MSQSQQPPINSQSGIDDIRRYLVELFARGQEDTLLDTVLSLIVSMRDTNDALQIRLQKLLRIVYGRKSEKISSAQLALALIEISKSNAHESAASDSAQDGPSAAPDEELPCPPPPSPIVEKDRDKNKQTGRQPLPDSLPRVQGPDEIVPPEKRTCPTCRKERACIGYHINETLEFVPSHFRIVETRCEKLICGSCENATSIQASPPTVVDRGRPGPGLIAHILVGKYQDSLPIERQADIYRRYGVSISASTLGRWASYGIDALEPILKKLEQVTLSSFLLNVDDTGLRVLDKDSPHGVKRGHIWVYSSEHALFYRYTPNWASSGPEALLSDYNGYVQGDGYGGYEAHLLSDNSELETQLLVPEERRLGCLMHLRRKFVDAYNAGHLQSMIAIQHIKKLYSIEKECHLSKVSADERHKRRQKDSLPILRELYSWIDHVHSRALPKTAIYKATTYARNQRSRIERCFSDGRFEIDNRCAESALRIIAVGRKNYLFAGSDVGAARVAGGYTLLRNCRLHKMNPLAYLTDVLQKISRGWPNQRLNELLPEAWAKEHPEHVQSQGLSVTDSP